MLLQEGRWLRAGFGLGLLLLLEQGCGGDVDPSTATLDCGGTEVVVTSLGPQALDVAVPRHVSVVFDPSVTTDEETRWKQAAANWRRVVGDACPIEFSFSHATAPVPVIGDKRTAPLDTIELRSDPPGVVEAHGGDGEHWLACRSGRASVAAAGLGFKVRVYQHELGHALGLDHDTSGKPSIMSNDPAFATRDVAPEDVVAYAAVWCPGRR